MKKSILLGLGAAALGMGLVLTFGLLAAGAMVFIARERKES